MAERLIREPIDLDLVIQLVAEPDPEPTDPPWQEPDGSKRRRLSWSIALGGALMLFTMDGPPPQPHHSPQAGQATAAAPFSIPPIAPAPFLAPTAQPSIAPIRPGQLSVGGQDLLTLPLDSSLAAFAEQAVEGRDVLVQSVVADEGFWVGPSAAERVLVYWHIDETPFQVLAGQRVNVRGVLSANPPGFERSFAIAPEEGADQLIRQAHHVVATAVTPAAAPGAG